MAEKAAHEKTLEMRVAELEDKLKGLQVTEEEMKAYNKVAALMGGASAGDVAARAPSVPSPYSCIVQQCIRACTVVQQCIRPCTVINQCTIVQQCIRPCIISDCINECGGGLPGAGGLGGGFGTLGG
jgi:hypothetical protein